MIAELIVDVFRILALVTIAGFACALLYKIGKWTDAQTESEQAKIDLLRMQARNCDPAFYDEIRSYHEAHGGH